MEAPREFCPQGHKVTDGNWYLEKNGRFRCSICRRKSRYEYYHNKPGAKEAARDRKRGCEHGIFPAKNCIECRYARSVRGSLQMGATPKSYDEFVSKAGSLDYLSLSPRQAQASADFNFAVDTKGRPLCEKPVIRKTGKKYYPHADFDPERPPSVTEAARMCMGCPVFDECGVLGRALNLGKSKSDGIFAGQVYVNGKRVIDKK